MASYIYIPIMTAEMAAMAADWNNGRRQLQKAAYPILGADSSGIGKALPRKFGGGYLSNVNAGDKVYVLAHGIKTPTSGGALAIGVNRGGHYVQDGTSLTGYTVQGGAWKTIPQSSLLGIWKKKGFRKTLLTCGCFAARQVWEQPIMATLLHRMHND